MAILDEGISFDEALSSVASFEFLRGPDRGLARAITSAALRQLGRLDAGLAPFLDRPIDSAAPPARALLRVGAAQLWLLNTPAHAAVSETVDAAKAWPRARRAAGLLNAVLRKAASHRDAFDAAPARKAWPDWLDRAMVDSLGTKRTAALAEAQSETPKLHLVPANGDTAGLAKAVGGAVHRSGVVVLDGASAVEDLPGFAEGRWWVQDAAATLAARLLAPAPGDKIVDLCAAPGGKTLQMAAAGAKVIAVDQSAPRLKTLRANLDRLQLRDTVEVVRADVLNWSPPDAFSKVLLDAPCSALGTLRRHPEGAWVKKPNDVSRYPVLQARFLKSALKMAAPGATIVYCVCTPLRAEGQDIVAAAVRAGLAEYAPITPLEAPGFEDLIDKAGTLTTIPRRDFPHDAFFIARLTRRT